MKPPKKPQAPPVRPAPSLPGWALAGLALWAAATVAYLLRSGDLRLGRDLGRWLASPFAVIPTLGASVGDLKRLVALGGVTLILLAAGRRALRLLKVDLNDPWEESALSFALGYGLLGSLLFLLGLAGVWQRAVLLAALAAALLWAAIELRLYSRESRSSPAGPTGRPTTLDRVCAGALVFGWLYVVRYALIPETFYDALHYHLALPSLYLQAGRIFATPENSFSGIPGLAQMLYGWTLAFDHWGITASLLHWSQAVWVAVAIVGLSRRLGRPQAGPLAAAAFGLMPVVLGESFRVSVGLELTLMELCQLTAFLAALSKDRGTPERRGWLVLCGSFLGFSMGMKYPAWLLPLVLLPGMALTRRERDANAPGASLGMRELGTVLLVAVLFTAPWVVKNLWFYHNPLYPFFHEFFAPKAEYMPGWRQISSAGTDINTFLSMKGFAHYLAHPWRLLTPPDDITETVGPFFLSLLPLLFFTRLTKQERLLGWFCLAAWLPLSLISSEPRFFIPHLAPLALLISCAIVQVQERRARTALLAIACALWGGTAVGWLAEDANRAKLDAYMGRKSFSEYLGHTVVSYPTPPFAGYEFLNETTPPGSRVMLYDEARSFYLQRPLLAASSDQAAVIEVWADRSADAAGLKKRLDDAGISYILVNLGEVSRRRREPMTTARGLMNLDAFWKKYTLRVFGVQNARDRWLGVYKVLDEAKASTPHPFDDLFAPFVEQIKTEKPVGS